MRGKSLVVEALAILSVVSLLAASRTEAQRTAQASLARPSVHPRSVGSHVAFPRSSTGTRTAPVARNAIHFNTASRSFESSDGSPVALEDLLRSVSPAGFSYTYLSAMNQDLGIKAVIDPATEWKLAVAHRFLHGRGPFGGSGFYLLDDQGGYAAPDDSQSADTGPADQPAQQPQVIVVQAAQPSEQAPEQPPADDSASLPDVGQFTLVLQSGVELQAVGFTRVKDRIVYITADGSRRTIGVDDLNSDATVRVNEERGTPLQLPL
jgi:hypothetical protein